MWGPTLLLCPLSMPSSTLLSPLTPAYMATIDIVDYYRGALLPSPESVRFDVSSISLPTLTKLGLLPFLRYSHGTLFFSAMFSKLSPAFPNLASFPNFVLFVALLTQHGFSETSTPMLCLPPPHPLHGLHPRSVRFSHPLFPPL